MNKKVLTALMCSAVVSCAFGFTACSGKNRTVDIDLDGGYGGYCTHVYGTPEYVPATCTSAGYDLSVCGLCGDENYNFYPADGHTWDNGTYLTQPDCTHNGLIQYTCADCSADKSEVVYARHDFADGVCLSCGITEYSEGLEFVLTDYGCDYGCGYGYGYVLTGIGTCTDSDLRIPETYEGLPVTAIALGWFESRTDIKSIRIPRFVTFISRFSFSGFTNLENVYYNAENCADLADWGSDVFNGSGGESGFSVVIGKAVKRVPANLFNWKSSSSQRTTALKSVVFEEGSVCESIGEKAFYYSEITQIEIPDSVKVIKEKAFYECNKLKSVKLGNGVEQIEGEAFGLCYKIESFTMSDSIKRLGFSFLNSYKLKYNVSNNLCYLGNENNPHLVLMDVADHSLKTYNISPYTKVIYNHAFYMCSHLRTLNIPDGVISAGGFDYCHNLEELYIPASVTHIDNDFFGGFYGCSGLNKITVDDNNPVYYENDGCLIERETKTLIFGYNTDVIPSDGSVTAIGDWAFLSGKCESFANLVIPEGITSIGNGAFSMCSNIESVTLPSTLTHLGNFAFRDSKGLKNIVIPEGVTEIGSQTFMGCKSLEYAVIPKSVTKIEDGAFTSCDNLTAIFYKGTYDDWKEKVWADNTAWTENTTVYYYTPSWHYENGEIVYW